MSYTRSFQVEPVDIDVQGHVNNQVYVRWIEELAVGHSEAVGWSHETYEKAGALFVMRRQEVDYLTSVRGDDVVDGRTWLEDARGVQCTRLSEFVRRSDGKVVARGKTLWVYLDARRGRPVKIPDEVRTAFGQRDLATVTRERLAVTGV